MTELKHPSELNSYQIFKQAKSLLKHTSRASSPDWYSEALNIDRQWHIWVDGGEKTYSVVTDQRSGQWMEGPELPKFAQHPGTGDVSNDALAQEHTDAIRNILREILGSRDLGGKAKSLGVVLHVANEFAVTDLAPEFAIDDDFDYIREVLTTSPAEALGDPSVDALAHSWRPMPYWGISQGERRCVAVSISREFEVLIDAVQKYGEERNVPVIAAAHSAPLEALTLAPYFLERAEGDGDIILFQYRSFSALAVLNRAGELLQLRSLQHRGAQEYPSGLGEVLVNTSASMNLHEPAVHIVPMSSVSQDDLIQELEVYFASRTPMNIGFVELSELEVMGKIPGGRFEMLLGDQEGFRATLANSAKLAASTTFEQLASGWGTQDFYGLSDVEKAVYPSQRDLKLLKHFGMFKSLMLVGVIGLVAWTSFEFVRAITTSAWRLSDTKASEVKLEREKLTAEKSRIEHWDNVMTKRSEGWQAMELILNLFPADSGVLVTEFDYQANADAKDDKAKAIGFERKWTIKGFAHPSAVSYLGQLGSNTFMAARFKELAEELGSDVYKPDEDTRALTVTLQQRQGEYPKNGAINPAVARQYRTSFEMTITQTFSDKDHLAIVVEPPTESKGN